MRKQHVLSGADRLETVDSLLRGKRVGLMTNPTGINHDFISTIDLIHQRYHLTALYAVEHGIRGDAQAGAKIDDTMIDPATGMPMTDESGHVLGYVAEPTKYYSVEGSNLYFALQKDGQPVDPVAFFQS